MKKILNYFLNLLRQFNKKKKDGSQILQDTIDLPFEISDDEKIARFVFSPINVNPKTGKLKTNCYKPPPGFDEISVNRLDYTCADFLKKIALKMQNPNRNYFGFGIINTVEIRKLQFEINYTPKNELSDYNPYHSDIKIGYTVVSGEELPAQINHKIQQMTTATRLYKDNNPTADIWTGEQLI
jgi:hypothetical protein